MKMRFNYKKVITTFVAQVAASILFLAPVHAADLAWTQAKTSTAINTLNSDVTVAYSHTGFGTVIPPGSVITQVHANHTYSGNALLQTYLC